MDNLPENNTQIKILALDDNLEDIRFLVQILTEQGYRINGIADDRRLFSIAIATKPDLIILDGVLPNISGYQLCEQLKANEHTQHIPVIFISASHKSADKIRAYSVGGVDYVTKPLQAEEILVRINAHLALGQMHRELQVKNQQLEKEIAKRKQIQQILERSKENYRNVVERGNDGIVIINKGCIEYHNPQMADMLDYGPDQLVGRNIDELVARQDQAKIQQRYMDEYNNDLIAGRVEVALYNAAGQPVPVEINASVIDYADHKAVLAFVRDITKRKIAVNALKNSEFRLKLAQRIAKTGSFEYDWDTDETFWSDQLYRLLGYQPDEFVPNFARFKEHIHHEDVKIFENAYNNAIANQTTYSLEYRIIQKNGMVRYLYAETLFERGASNKIIKSYGTLVDITERKSAESALVRLYNAIEQATDSIAITDNDGIIQYTNPAFGRESGYKQKDILGHTHRLVKSDQHLPEFYEDLWQTIQAGNFFRAEFINRRKNGQLYCQEQSITPIIDHLGRITHYVAVGRDTTERQKMEAKLLKAYQDVNSLNSHLQQELHLAHDIQQGLLPPGKPDWPDLDVICYSEPALQVGGDLYVYKQFKLMTRGSGQEINDNSPLPYQVTPDHYIVALGDVSGKGMPAALLMAVSLVMLQAFSRHTLRPSRLLNHLDRAIMPYTKTTRQNCALVFAEITPPSANVLDPNKKGILRVANAGCVTPIIKRANGLVEWVDIGGMPLGVGLGLQLGYKELSLKIATGDFIILTSDGVIEANNANGEMFGFDRLEQTVITGPMKTAENMLDHIKKNVLTFTEGAEQHDDMTIVVIKV
ncbi:PAS domain S-box protein [Anaerolineales bacterium HSG24]|nr:PAS domain S-box protein [Anaerolineales bacterium HSG24]